MWASTVFPSAMSSTFSFLNKLESGPPSPALSSVALVILTNDGHGSSALGEGFSEWRALVSGLWTQATVQILSFLGECFMTFSLFPFTYSNDSSSRWLCSVLEFSRSTLCWWWWLGVRDTSNFMYSKTCIIFRELGELQCAQCLAFNVRR